MRVQVCRSLRLGDLGEKMEQVFNRSGHNPLITAADLPFPASVVMNAGLLNMMEM